MVTTEVGLATCIIRSGKGFESQGGVGNSRRRGSSDETIRGRLHFFLLLLLLLLPTHMRATAGESF